MPDRTPIDRGIIFSPPMVRAILAGQKTQTRRLASSPLAKALPGDRLWVRETTRFWSAGHDCELTFPADGATRQTGPNTGEIPDASLPAYFKRVDRSRKLGRGFGVPSIHMPRWASRITLAVTDVRFEPVDQISREDAIAEGVSPAEQSPGYFEVADFIGMDPVAVFACLWDSLHDQEGERFAEGPAIVALTFAATLANIDASDQPHA